MKTNLTGNKIREQFIEYFKNKGHAFVPSSSLVPGGDQTLLFTNAGMVQFKDVFLGTDNRPYKRAVNSQKCMRVSGKHNDLDDVGRDDTHHTFFEMLGNWSFGDYYKNEAITWAWELLTDIWGIEKESLWVTCFKDEKDEIPTDEEASSSWKKQKGINADHIVFFGRKDNFWEMAETGPCGPCSEIHIDRGESFCNKKDLPDHECTVNGDCQRFLELWNLVFIQYNRLGPTKLNQLPACHVDTGMGFERIVSVLQDVRSNYHTDLLLPLMDVAMKLSGKSVKDRDLDPTPFRVIADHCRAASFLIADGVVPGNIGRNYICRMIIRRASRFGTKIGLEEPFLGSIAEKVVEIYGDAYPELNKNKNTIIDNLTREEKRFRSTVEGGLAILDSHIERMRESGEKILEGEPAFELYATHGLPLEITRDVLEESGYKVDQDGFYESMEKHRLSSGAGKEFGPLGGEDAEFYSEISKELTKKGLIGKSGIISKPHGPLSIETEVLALIKDGQQVDEANKGDIVEIIVKESNYYIESGGQVSDTGVITCSDGDSVLQIKEVRKPAPGTIIHTGEMKSGSLSVGQKVLSNVNKERRRDIMRNHTATHLLHAVLQDVLGDHVRQAGSLVAPDRLRFDFTHPEAVHLDDLTKIENKVNKEILENKSILASEKSLAQALDEGAMALFGEKYADQVRTISIGEKETFSYELCGGTHVSDTSKIGTFLITSEGSAAAGIRRIEAVTGRKAYAFIQKRMEILKESASLLGSSVEELSLTANRLLEEKKELTSKIALLDKNEASNAYIEAKKLIVKTNNISLLKMKFDDVPVSLLREVSDEFRKDFKKGIAVLTNIDSANKIQFIVTVTNELIKEKYHAGKIAKLIASDLGGSGGGRPNLAQGGGKDVDKLDGVLKNLSDYIKSE